MGSSTPPRSFPKPGPYGAMDQPNVTQQVQPLAQNDQTMAYSPYASLGTPTNGAQPDNTGFQGGGAGLLDQQDILARTRDSRGGPMPFFG